MGDEEFRDLLDQLVLNKPQSALVRELCADASKDEPFQSPPDVLSSLHSASSSSPAWSKSNAVAGRPGASDQQPGSSSRKSGSSSGNNNNRNRSVRSERTSESSGQEHDQNSLNSQSLQDLVSMESEGKERRKNKTTRANSFTEDGGETSRSSAGRGGSGTGKMRLRSGPPLPSTTSVNHKKAHSCNKNLSSSSTPITSSSTYSSPSSSSATTIVNASSASSSISSDPQARSSASPMKHHPSPKDTSNHRHNSSNVNKSDCDVESGRSDSSSRIFTPSLRTYSNTCHSSNSSNSNNYNHNNGSSSVVPVVAGSTSRTCPQTQPPPAGAHPVHVCREENLMEELENAFEMQDLRKQAEIVPISSLNGSRPPLSGPQDVDSVVHFNKLDSRSTVDPQYAELCHLGQDHGPSSGSRSGKTRDETIRDEWESLLRLVSRL